VKTRHLRQEVVISGHTLKIGDTVRISRLRGRLTVAEIRDDDCVSGTYEYGDHKLTRTFRFDRVVFSGK
jgi:hypothetical protein